MTPFIALKNFSPFHFIYFFHFSYQPFTSLHFTSLHFTSLHFVWRLCIKKQRIPQQLYRDVPGTYQGIIISDKNRLDPPRHRPTTRRTRPLRPRLYLSPGKILLFFCIKHLRHLITNVSAHTTINKQQLCLQFYSYMFRLT